MGYESSVLVSADGVVIAKSINEFLPRTTEKDILFRWRHAVRYIVSNPHIGTDLWKALNNILLVYKDTVGFFYSVPATLFPYSNVKTVRWERTHLSKNSVFFIVMISIFLLAYTSVIQNFYDALCKNRKDNIAYFQWIVTVGVTELNCNIQAKHSFNMRVRCHWNI